MTHLQTIDSSIQDLVHATADLATVMGPAQAGQLDQQQLQQRLQTIGTPPPGRATEEQKQEYLGKLSTLIQQITQSQIDSNINQATQNITTKTKAIENAIATTKQALHTLEKQDDSSAVTTYNSSIDKITTLMTHIANRDVLYRSVGVKLDTAYNGLDPDNTNGNDQIDKLQTLQRNIQEQKQSLQNQIIQYYDNTFRDSKVKTNLIELKIPKDIHTGKGQMLIDNMKAYLRGRASEYYAIIPYLQRISDDFDNKQGTYWKPPTKANGYNGVPDVMMEAFINQAQALYHVIMDQLTTEVKNKIKSTYKYGTHQQHEDRCNVGDGPSAYFALISLYKPIKAAHRDTLTETFNTAWTHFLKGDPVNKINYLRPRLVEAIQLNLPLNWSTTGKKIIQVLSRQDHVMAQELKQYEKGPTDPDQTNTYLQDLFAAVEAEAEKAKWVSTGSKEKEWHAHNVTAHTNNQSRPCKFGVECTDKYCTRSHPRGHKRPRDGDTAYDQSHGKGGKGYTGKGGKGKAGKGKGGKGKGKGGKGRPACEAEGCSQPTPHPSKSLCTTCFKKVIDTGSITKKNGTTFTLKGRDEQQQQEGKAYGFSAEQLEGLKIMHQASAYTADALSHIEPAAPASVKRARIAERLGKRADAATAEQDKRTSDFLAAINSQ
jgi:hypothetical protein